MLKSDKFSDKKHVDHLKVRWERMGYKGALQEVQQWEDAIEYITKDNFLYGVYSLINDIYPILVSISYVPVMEVKDAMKINGLPDDRYIKIKTVVNGFTVAYLNDRQKKMESAMG